MNTSYLVSTASDLARVRPMNEFRELTTDWAESSVPQRFAESLEENPDRAAIKVRNQMFSYQIIDQLANRIANSILARTETATERAVCLLFEHEDEVPAAILGVLKSGRFYVSLDPTHPRQRLEAIIRDSDADLIVTSEKHFSLAESLVKNRNRAIDINGIKSATSEDDPKIAIRPENLAYLTYTSGSTGEPKGVVHTHRSLLHNVLRHTNERRLCSTDRMALFFSYNFGASTSNLFCGLLNGAAAFVFDLKRQSLSSLIRWLNDEKITVIHTVPTFFRHFVRAAVGQSFPHLRLIRLAGETIYRADLESYKEIFDDRCLLNVGMGTTETGAILGCFFDKRTPSELGAVPTGYPTKDVDVLLLNGEGQPVGVGKEGEMVVRSAYLSAGYWGRPDLTEKAFLRDREGGNERAFLTRDLGCRLPDGRIVHRGRKDSQVKVRGHRVEVAEVETALLEIPGVKEAAVTLGEHTNGSEPLVAGIVRDSDSTLPVTVLRSLLKKRLPDFMIPSVFTCLENLPLTASGKIDRPALSRVTRDAANLNRDYVPARDQLDAQLIAIWEELLELDRIGIRDDFFELGGDSLLAVNMICRIEEALGLRINLANFVNELTIELLADFIEAEEAENNQRPILEIQRSGTKLPLFFLHGDYYAGGIFCRNLARYLGSEQPFFTIPPHGLDCNPLPPSIEAMAEDRVKALLEFRPEGPYLLGGFCWGGLVALEMARQLGAIGKTVERVILIDSEPRNVEFRVIRRVVSTIARVLGQSQVVEERLFKKIRWFFVRVRDTEGALGKFRFLLSKIASVFTSRDPGVMTLDREITELDDKDRHSRWYAYHELTENYVTNLYLGELVLFRSSRLQKKHPEDLTAGWSRVSPEVEVVSIAGDHWTCITKHANQLARSMQPFLG